MSLRLVALLLAMLMIPILVLVGIGAWEIGSDPESDPQVFACSDEGEKMLPQLQDEIEHDLSTLPGLRTTVVGQCYEGGTDGVSIDFVSPLLSKTKDTLESSWQCKPSTKSVRWGEVKVLRCRTSNFTVDVEVDDPGNAYISFTDIDQSNRP